MTNKKKILNYYIYLKIQMGGGAIKLNDFNLKKI